MILLMLFVAGLVACILAVQVTVVVVQLAAWSVAAVWKALR